MPSALRADYGLDAPGVVRLLAYGGLSLFVLSLGGIYILPGTSRSLIVTGLIWSSIMLVEVAWMVWGSYVGKLRQRDRLLDMIGLRGDEVVLDVGCGRGLLLVGAAKRLTKGGRSLGIDLWAAKDQSGNSLDAVKTNARIEGVEDRIDVETADMRRIPIEDATIDVIVSSLAVHNIPDEAGRDKAIREMARVLKPGGRLFVQDFQKTARYVQVATAAGLVDARRSGLYFTIFPPVRIVTARKP